jgi:Tfp pilus assembly protein PilO
MPIRRESKMNSTIIIALLVLVGAIACIYYIGLPSARELKTKNQELAVAQANNKAAKEHISDVQVAYGKLAAIEAQLELLNIAAPVDPDLPEALIQINEIVNKNQLNLESLSPGNKSGNALVIGLTVNGNYAQLKQCLVDLEKNLRPVKIDSVSMASSENEEGGATTGGTYDIKMSYVGVPDETGSQTDTSGTSDESTTNTNTTSSEASSSTTANTSDTQSSLPQNSSTTSTSPSKGGA